MATSTSRVVDDHDVEVPGVEDHTHAISRCGTAHTGALTWCWQQCGIGGGRLVGRGAHVVCGGGGAGALSGCVFCGGLRWGRAQAH